MSPWESSMDCIDLRWLLIVICFLFFFCFFNPRWHQTRAAQTPHDNPIWNSSSKLVKSLVHFHTYKDSVISLILPVIPCYAVVPGGKKSKYAESRVASHIPRSCTEKGWNTRHGAAGRPDVQKSRNFWRTCFTRVTSYCFASDLIILSGVQSPKTGAIEALHETLFRPVVMEEKGSTVFAVSLTVLFSQLGISFVSSW